MAKKFSKLTRAVMNTLTSGQKLVEHGIEYERLANGDGRFSINIMVDAKRIHRVIGVESDGVTRRQAEEYSEQVKTCKRHTKSEPYLRKVANIF
jgi:hypothetical protein